MTLELWSHPENDAERSCCSPRAVVGARALAHSMGIPHFTLDLREDFRAAVVDDFLAEYEAGRTPNPCVRCNGMVRFDAMLELAERLGAARLATGHYARVTARRRRTAGGRRGGPAKDQSYMLARLSPAHARAAPLPARRAREAAGARARARRRPAGGGQARVAGPLLPGGRGRPRVPAPPRRRRERPARSWTSRAACWAATTASATSRWGSGEAWASAAREPLYVVAKDAAQRPRVGGAQARPGHAPRERARRAPAPPGAVPWTA